ncbi:MAG: 50S ribosomal protein L20 [Balneolaceae bacterium]
MPRSRNLVASRRRRRKILNQAKGYWGSRKNVYTVAKNAVEKGLQYQYRDRKNRKRTFRRLWITRINAAARLNGTTYGNFIHGMKQNDMEINRKMLADIAVRDPETFSEIVKEAVK